MGGGSWPFATAYKLGAEAFHALVPAGDEGAQAAQLVGAAAASAAARAPKRARRLGAGPTARAPTKLAAEGDAHAFGEPAAAAGHADDHWIHTHRRAGRVACCRHIWCIYMVPPHKDLHFSTKH